MWYFLLYKLCDFSSNTDYYYNSAFLNIILEMNSESELWNLAELFLHLFTSCILKLFLNSFLKEAVNNCQFLKIIFVYLLNTFLNIPSFHITHKSHITCIAHLYIICHMSLIIHLSYITHYSSYTSHITHHSIYTSCISHISQHTPLVLHTPHHTPLIYIIHTSQIS